MSSPTATIVITTFNRHSLAERAVGCALAQTVSDLQVIVVDDGSDPPFRPSTGDPRVELIRNESSRGPSAARNAALGQARGEWISFLDDDDVITPEMLQVSVDAAAASPLPAPVSVLTGAAIVDEQGHVLKTRLPPSLPKGRHFFLEDLDEGGSFQTHATLVAPTQVVRDIGGFDAELRGSEHDDFFLRLNAVSSIQGVPTVTYRITAHAGPRLSKAVLERAEGMARTVAKHEETFAQHPRRFANYLGTMGITYLRAGRWAPAVSATWRSLRLDPTNPRAYAWWLAALAGPRVLSLMRKLRAALGGGWSD